MGDKTWSFLKNIYADLILFLSRRRVCLDYFYEKKKKMCAVSQQNKHGDINRSSKRS